MIDGRQIERLTNSGFPFSGDALESSLSEKDIMEWLAKDNGWLELFYNTDENSYEVVCVADKGYKMSHDSDLTEALVKAVEQINEERK